MSNDFVKLHQRDSASSESIPMRTVDCGDGTFAMYVVGTPWHPVRGEMVDRSDVIATGGLAQEVMATNPERAYFFFQNLSDTDMWLDFGVEAVDDSPSILIPSGQAFPLGDSFIPTQSVSVLCTATAKKFIAKEGQ